MYFMLFIVLEVKLNVKPDVTAARHHEVVDTLVEVAGSGHAFGIEWRFIVYHPKIAAYKRYIDIAYIAYPVTGDGIADARFLKADVRRAVRIVLGQAAGTGNDLKPFLCIYMVRPLTSTPPASRAAAVLSETPYSSMAAWVAEYTIPPMRAEIRNPTLIPL